MILLSACNNEEVFQVSKPEFNLEEGRTISLTATMPEDGPNTRVSLTKEESNTIALKWEVDDELELVFVQGENKIKSVVTVATITENGKKAHFIFDLPIEITAGNFDLYGIYGGGQPNLSLDIGLPGIDASDISVRSLSDDNPTDVILPKNPGNATSLEHVEIRNDVMLYFRSENINQSNSQISVNFKHLGSLFSINLKNSGSTSLDDLQEVRLLGINNTGNTNWAYNSGEGGQIYDLVSKMFQDITSGGNYISFKASENSLASGEIMTFWGWYPPLPDLNWPELKLEVRSSSSLLATSLNSKPARDLPTDAGKSYYFYAALDGGKLEFTDETFATTPLGPDEYYVANDGTLGTDVLTTEQKENITKLILKGKINSVDFEVMNAMPNLTYIDLKDVTCVDNLIPDGAFSENENIITIILPNELESIGNFAFKDCSSLIGSLVIPDGVTSIGEYAFKGCSGFTGPLTLPDGLTEINQGVFDSCTGFTGSLTFPDGVISIGEFAFNGCTGFTGSLSLPDGLESIGDNAFKDCSSFTGSLTIPSGVTIIGRSAFENCSGFTGSLTLPNGLLTLDHWSFKNCTGFTGSLILPADLIQIEKDVFQNCAGFTGSLTIPNGVKEIRENAFRGCTGFTGSLTLSSELKTIRQYAFHSCSGFTDTLIIPAGVSSIGGYAFRLFNITAFRFLSPIPITYVDYMLETGIPIQVPADAIEEYIAAPGWTPRHTFVPIP